ncbi:hypothetical protein [Aeromicrobium sp. 9AM]|uniref:hypothetical protein n=1 Tax=Aeromicrobium sp. 9AM TaxID=2653126 RepID=UPI00135B036B|nr:hypothetical protein [Aeromicrobium sp. 9AM]
MARLTTEVQLVGDEDEVLAFVDYLGEVEGDLSVLIYRHAFNEWKSAMTDEVRMRVEDYVGAPLFAAVTEGPEQYQDQLSMMLAVVSDRFALREALCLRTLFDFAVGVWLVDPVTGRSDHVVVGE